MSRRLRRDLNKRIPSAGYHKFSGDVEVTGWLIGPSIANIVMAITKLVSGTTTPVQLTITHCDGVYKGIVVHWDRQYNLANFDHYEIQVSADQTNWYSLKLDGTGWQGTINQWTSTPDNFIPHFPIPFGGTAENPIAIRLYYRVRQVTILGVEGAWSDVANATTSLIETGDIAARSIAATKMIVGELTAREMAFGAEEGGYSVYEDADPAAPAAEIFDLSQPDCVGSRGTIPAAGKEVVYAPPTAIDEVLREFRGFHSPRMIGQSEALFQTAKNLIKSPEDLTTADWTPVGAPTQVLTNQYVDGKRLTKIGNTGAAADYVQQVYTAAFTQAGIAGSVICRKGSSVGNVAYIRIYDIDGAANIFTLPIDFDNYPNAPGAPGGGGTLHNYTWIDSETVEIQWIGTLAAAGNDIRIYLYGSPNATDGEYTYWTAVQLEDLPYPTPYIDQYRYPTGVRPAVSPNYAVTMPEKFAFKVKIRPWFAYDTAIGHRIAEWHVDVNHRFILYYISGSDKFCCWWKNDVAGTTRYLYTQVFDDSAPNDVNSEIILYGQIDLSTQLGNNAFFAIVAGVKQAEDNDWGGAPDAYSATLTTLSIGHELAANHADSLIEYAKFWTWDGAALGTLADETDIDRVTADLTSLFDLTLEDYSLARYKPVSKQGAIGIFQKTKNLVDFPEDLTDASWLDENANITPSLSDYYINGKRFTKLLITDANPAFTYKDVEVTTATPSFQAIFMHGLSDVTVIDLTERGVATRGTITITWSTKTIAVADGATNLEYVWITDKKVWVAATAAAVVIANDVEIHIYPDTTEANLDHIYVTAVMVEDIAHPTPYTPTERAKDGILNYPFEMPEKFSICFWVRPWFKYTSTNFHRFIEWIIDATHRFMIYYDSDNDLIKLYWIDGGVARGLASQTFDDGTANDDINQEIFVAASVDLSSQDANGSRLKVYADTIGESTGFGAAPDAKSSSFPTLSIGQEAGRWEADAFLSDLMILPNVLLTEEQMDRHYNTRRPWYSLSEVASFDRQVRIDRNGIRLHNAELNITDWRNRQILISNRDGMKALDAAGKCIHDIADAPVLVGNRYCGHRHWFQDLGTYILLNTTSPTLDSWTEITCLNTGNDNMRLGLFKIHMSWSAVAQNYPFMAIYFRPKGTSWDKGTTSNTPGWSSQALTGAAHLTLMSDVIMMECPIGDDDKIEYYFSVPGASTDEILTITQLGGAI